MWVLALFLFLHEEGLELIETQGFRFVGFGKAEVDLFFAELDAFDDGGAVGGVDLAANGGPFFFFLPLLAAVLRLVWFVIAQAAFRPVALADHVVGVVALVLVLWLEHLLLFAEGVGMNLLHPAGTAEAAAAGAEAVCTAGFFAGGDLHHLDAGVEVACQVAHE
ncbi:hypothetical protein Ptc2401_00790 [Prosthecochloris sp. CIB 2401]|nr:hypothetical protein Ptc2401_00790 [Prosthecochloris sp. CIB 2401]